MEQPKKEKKKPNGQVVSGTEDVRKSQQDINATKNFTKYLSKDKYLVKFLVAIWRTIY